MDLSQSLVSVITKPTFVFVQLEPPQPSLTTSTAPLPSWGSSPINPKNRINSLDVTRSHWRVDGATMCGRQFYVVPTCLLPNLVPLRVDVFIPDQEQHPPELREALQSSFSACMRHARLGQLGISRHLCRALDHHCAENPRFWHDYQTLPFGSKLIFENIAADVKAMTLTVEPAHDLERQLLSVPSLQKLWRGDVPIHSWPRVVDLNRLRLKQQLHDSISVINMVAESGGLSTRDFVFKSSTVGPKFLYRELKFLLTNSHHVNLIGAPLYIVTKKCNFGGKHGICGFILPYYPLGSIRDILPIRTLAGTLTFRQQINWSRQIVSALIHIREVAGTFYSDLRPDNVLLSQSEPNGPENLVLCDFEQRGNWHEWCPPEILYQMYAANLCAHPSPAAQSQLPQDLVNKRHDSNLSGNPLDRRTFNTHPLGSNPEWCSLSWDEQEKAQVYSLGLLLYCIFEGMSNVRVSIANAWPCEPDVEFPHFKRTPPSMRYCIRRCTIDAPDWVLKEKRSEEGGIPLRRPGRVTRMDGKLYPAGHINANEDNKPVAETVFETAKAWWKSEIGMAKRFFESAPWRDGNTGKERPTLREVLAMLDGFDE